VPNVDGKQTASEFGRPDAGVSGIEFRDGESDAFKMDWSWRLKPVFETADESVQANVGKHSKQTTR
jgi:hypothetical protein